MWRITYDGNRETCSICSGNTIVEVVVGKGTEKRVYSEKGAALDYAMSDAELIDKFMRNIQKSLNE